MAFTQITSTNITENTVVAYAEYAAFTANVLPKISSVQYADATSDGTLWSWGLNNRGQLGQNDIAYRSSPTQVGSGTPWNLVSIGQYNTIATRTA